jgi:hypothetical protein
MTEGRFASTPALTTETLTEKMNREEKKPSNRGKRLVSILTWNEEQNYQRGSNNNEDQK